MYSHLARQKDSEHSLLSWPKFPCTEDFALLLSAAQERGPPPSFEDQTWFLILP